MAIAASGTGTMSVYIGSQLMELTGKVDLEHGGIQRTPVSGPGGIIPGRFVEKYVVPTLSIEVSDGPAVDMTALKDVVDVSIQLAMRNGKTFLITRGCCTGEVKGDLTAGTFTLEYFGTSCEEILP